MGHATSWIAINGKNIDIALSLLQLKKGTEIGQLEDFKNETQGISLADAEWTVIITGRNHIEPSPTLLASLSQDGRIVACSMEEHCMYSEASEWVNGEQVWFTSHNGKPEKKSIGKLPPCHAKLSIELEAKQKAQKKDKHMADYLFEIPIETARGITGFRYDDENPTYDSAGFLELIDTTKPKESTSLLSRILGILSPSKRDA